MAEALLVLERVIISGRRSIATFRYISGFTQRVPGTKVGVLMISFRHGRYPPSNTGENIIHARSCIVPRDERL
jgi:hypothetical protein